MSKSSGLARPQSACSVWTQSVRKDKKGCQGGKSALSKPYDAGYQLQRVEAEIPFFGGRETVPPPEQRHRLQPLRPKNMYVSRLAVPLTPCYIQTSYDLTAKSHNLQM